MTKELPVACTLSSAELQLRRATILQRIKADVINVTELESGFRFAFSGTRDQIQRLGALIELEHECCPFLQFQLTVESGDGPALLELTGPEGTKEFLKTLLL
jgi:hypothetical protein